MPGAHRIGWLGGVVLSSEKINVSVVVPVFNEAGNVAPLAGEIVAAMAGREDYEIVFVDDGSTDGTPAALAEMTQKFARFRALVHDRNAGQSAAIRSGVMGARGAWIVTLDGDGQNDPADIPLLFGAAEEPGAPKNLAMVAGVRAKRRDNWLRRASSRIANTVRARLLGDRTPDTGCGLKLFRRDAFLDLPSFDHMHRFLPALMLRDGGGVVHVEVRHRPRLSGQSKYGLGINSRLWVGIVDLVGVRWLQRRALRADASELGAKAGHPTTAMSGSQNETGRTGKSRS